MNKRTRVVNGMAAVRAGSPDFGQNDLETDFTDALANIRHAALAKGVHWGTVVRLSREHFDAELRGEL